MTQALKNSVCYISLWPPSPKWALKTVWVLIMEDQFVFSTLCRKQVITTFVFHFKLDAVTAKKDLNIYLFFGLKLRGYVSVSLASLPLQTDSAVTPYLSVCSWAVLALTCVAVQVLETGLMVPCAAAAKASQDSFPMSCWLTHLFVWVQHVDCGMELGDCRSLKTAAHGLCWFDF